MPSYGCQSPEHETDHANPNHRFTVIQSDFIIPTKPTRLGKPTEGSFYYPALREHFETFGAIRAAHDLQLQFAKGTQLLHPLDQGAQVTTIGPNDLQPPVHGYHEFDETLGGVAVLHGRGCDQNRQDQSQAVHRHVAFAPRHLFARVVAAVAGLIGDLDRLTVNDRCGRCDLSPFGLAQAISQRVVNEPPSPILSPAPIVTLDGLPGTKVSGQKSPGTARANHIEDALDQGATIQLERSATLSFSTFRSRNQTLDVFPFFIGQIRWITSWMRLHPSHL